MTKDKKDGIDSIELPITQDIFKHLNNARLFGMDIGGSLVKIAYSSSYVCRTASFSEVIT
jgi:pantothenate kinase